MDAQRFPPRVPIVTPPLIHSPGANDHTAMNFGGRTQTDTEHQQRFGRSRMRGIKSVNGLSELIGALLGKLAGELIIISVIFIKGLCF